MATVTTYADAEGGITNGTALTNANNGTANGNTNFARVDVLAGNTVIASNSWSGKTGTLAYQLTQSGTNRPAVFGVLGGARTDPSFNFTDQIPAAPAISGPIFRMFSDGGFATPAIDFQITPSGKMFIRDAVGATNSSNSTGTLLYTTEEYCFAGDYNDTTKLATFTAFVKGTTTVRAQITMTMASNVTVQSWEMGWMANSMNATHNFDLFQAGYGGPQARLDVVNSPPVATRVTPSLNAIDAGAAFSMQWNMADADGNMAAGAAITCTTRPAGSALPTITLSGFTPGSPTATITGTIAAGQLTGVGRYVFTLTGTDSAGGAMTGQTTITLDTAPTINTPTDIRTLNDLNYNQFGSQANLTTAMIDGDDNTGIESPNSPVAEPWEVFTGALKTNGITWRFKAYVNGGSTGSYRVRAYKNDGTTLLQTFTGSLTNVNNFYSGQLSTTALGLIPLPVDRVNLKWVLDGTTA